MHVPTQGVIGGGNRSYLSNSNPNGFAELIVTTTVQLPSVGGWVQEIDFWRRKKITSRRPHSHHNKGLTDSCASAMSQGAASAKITPGGEEEAKKMTAQWAAAPNDALKLGVKLALGEWQALQLAVSNKWGGSDTALRLEYFEADICDWFLGPQKRIRTGEVENFLEEVMNEDFQVEAEDGSLQRVASLLTKLRTDVLTDKSFLGLLRMWQRARRRGKIQIEVEAKQDSDKADPELFESGDGDAKAGGSVMPSLVGAGGMDVVQEGDEGGEEPSTDAKKDNSGVPKEPLVDDDGFELVTTKRRGRRR